MDEATKHDINVLARHILDYGREQSDASYLKGVRFGVSVAKNFITQAETLAEAESQVEAYLKGMDILSRAKENI